MFNKTRNILKIEKEKISLAQVSVSNKKILKLKDEVWSKDTMRRVLNDFKREFKLHSIRVLISDELSYIVDLELPPDLDSGAERKYIAEKVSEKIPEILENNEWDYKKADGSNKVVVFAPVKSFFDTFKSSAESEQLHIEAVEPESMAVTRNTDPIIGLALKEDIKGSDEKVLNLEVTGTGGKKESWGNETAIKPTEKKTISKSILILVLVFLITLALVLYYFGADKSKNTLINLTAISESVSPSSTLTPTSEHYVNPRLLDIKNFRIQVQYKAGSESDLKNIVGILENAGFENISTSSALLVNRSDTNVRLRNGVSQDYYAKLAEVLSGSYEVSSSSADLIEFDAVISVGKK